ncbi:MAG: alpha-N-arabinofuranosidase [Candidatus Helarchaeota archaeon]
MAKLKDLVTNIMLGIGILIFRLFVQPLGLKKVNKEIKKLTEPAGPVPNDAEVTIDVANIVSEINPYIYGSFIEVLARCIYGGIWDEYNENVELIHGGLRKDVVEATRELGVTILRYPGGCFADVYHWKDGIGPREQRKRMKNAHWHWLGPKIGPWHDNHFGSDEFMLFVKETNTNPYININLGSGTPEEAAQWVEYMNGTTSTEYGALRAKNGHPEPYNVKIWGIGNEIFGSWEKGTMSAEKYGEKYLEYAKAMRQVDPTIKLVAVGAGRPNWNTTVLKIAGTEIDYLSLHCYIPPKALTTMSNRIKDFYNIIAGAFEMERQIKRYESMIEEAMGAKEKIPISFDEWNALWNTRQHFEGYYTLRDGIFAASVFEVMHRHAKTVKLATQAQLTNVIPMIVTNEKDLYVNPIYLAFQLFSKHAEQYLVDFTVTCDTRPNPKYANIEATEIPYLGCSVTTNEDHTQLVIIGINRHHAHDLRANISIKNFEPRPLVKVFELNGPHHSAYNFFHKKDEVKIVAKDFSSAAKEFHYTFLAHSVTALILQKKQ